MMLPYIELGKFRIFPLLDGYFRLDGGSIFGIVPKVIWAPSMPVDEKNRIRLAMRCLLVEANDHWILIDTGIGDKFSPKQNEIYAVERIPRLEDQLSEIGVSPADIHFVINSHLHFDHAGGNTKRNAANTGWEPAFPNARYVEQKGEYEMATHINERTKGSYRIDDYVALEKEGVMDLIEGDHRLIPGVTILRSGGHVPYHQCVLLESGKDKAFFLGDLVSTHIQLALPYITAFDLEPLVTLEKKKEYLNRAVEEDWLLFFAHDIEIISARIRMQDGKFQMK